MKRLNVNVIMNITFQLINILYGFILPQTLINVYGSEINGIFSITVQIIGYMKIVEAGLGAASTRQFYKPLTENDEKSIGDLFQSINFYYRKIANQFIVLTLIIAIIYSQLVNTNVSEIDVVLIIIIMSFNTYFEFFYANKYYVYFLASNQIYKFQITQILAQIVKILIVISSTFLNIEVTVLVLMLTLTVFIKTSLLSRIFKRENIQLNRQFDLKMIDQKNSVLSHQLLELVIYNSPIVIISVMINAESASIYAIYSLVFTTFYSFFTLIFNQSVLPTIGHGLATNDLKKVRLVYEKYNKFGVAIIFVIIATSIITFQHFIYLYTSGADLNYYSYLTTALFALYTFVNCLKIPYLTLVNANGEFKSTIVHSVVEVLIFISVIIIFHQYVSINLILIALLLSCIYKTTSLKIFSNIKVLKENWEQHYYQLVTILFLCIILVYIYLYKITIDIENAFQWILYSSVITIIMSILALLLFSAPILAKRVRARMKNAR